VSGETRTPVKRIGMPYVLVVDDHPINLELARFVLENHGCQVDTACGGEAALDQIARRRPELVLLDIQMPGVDGFEVVRRLRSDSATRSIVLIAFTAYAMPGDERRFLAAGFDGYLPKPIDIRTFGAQVQRIFDGLAG
jgi:two-component system cell cycle response regulator DivK